MIIAKLFYCCTF